MIGRGKDAQRQLPVRSDAGDDRRGRDQRDGGGGAFRSARSRSRYRCRWTASWRRGVEARGGDGAGDRGPCGCAGGGELLRRAQVQAKRSRARWSAESALASLQRHGRRSRSARTGRRYRHRVDDGMVRERCRGRCADGTGGRGPAGRAGRSELLGGAQFHGRRVGEMVCGGGGPLEQSVAALLCGCSVQDSCACRFGLEGQDRRRSLNRSYGKDENLRRARRATPTAGRRQRQVGGLAPGRLSELCVSSASTPETARPRGADRR